MHSSAVEHGIADPAVTGSIPVVPSFETYRSGVAQRKRVGLITQRSEDRNLPPLFLFGRVRFPNVKALVAQLAALRSYEPVAQGSSPCRSSFLTLSHKELEAPAVLRGRGIGQAFLHRRQYLSA